MSRAVYVLPRAEVRTSAGLRSRNLRLSSVIEGLSGSVNEGSDGVVAAGGLAQGEASGVGSARVQEAVADPSGAELGKARVGSPRALALVHLKQAYLNACRRRR